MVVSMNSSNQDSQTSEDRPWTIKRLLDWTTEHFEKRDPDNPRLRAEVLLAEALECQRIELYTQFDNVPTGGSLITFREWVKRHAAGEPVAYIVGSKEFYSLRFHVESSVLIPRPETEHLVMETIEMSKRLGSSPLKIMDVGTGSGCIAIAIAKHLPGSQMSAVDISSAALNVARKNASELLVGQEVDWIESDLFEQVCNDLRFDLIVSNPPYIGTNEQNTVDAVVRDFEPHVALFSGGDGMDVIRRLVGASVERLTDNGFLIFEISPLIEESCRVLIQQTADLDWVKTVQDYSGHPRVMVAQRKTN